MCKAEPRAAEARFGSWRQLVCGFVTPLYCKDVTVSMGKAEVDLGGVVG